MRQFRRAGQTFVILIASFLSTACIGTVVGAVVDTAVEIVKIPVKVGAAVIDAAIPDDDEKMQLQLEDASEDQSGDEPLDDDQRAVQMEQEVLQ